MYEQVIVEDSGTDAVCYSLGYPHMRTLDGV